MASFDTKKKFTGKELDDETGLYYYGARYYDPRIARFVSLDPVGRDLSQQELFTNPQRWNTYSYALNNPVRYTDPSGMYSIEEFGNDMDGMTQHMFYVGDIITLGAFSNAFNESTAAAQKVRDEGATPANVANAVATTLAGSGKLIGISFGEGAMLGHMRASLYGVAGATKVIQKASEKPQLTNPNTLIPTEGIASQARVKALENSLLKNGPYSQHPVRYFEYQSQKYIIDGHHRVQAAINTGQKIYTKPGDSDYLKNVWHSTVDSFVGKINDYHNK